MMTFIVRIMTPTRKVERSFWNDGHKVVAGLDEVGRGALAGPVVAAAVVLPERCRLKGVKDSKQLSAMKRDEASTLIKQQAMAVGIGWVSHEDVDEHGLTWAVRQSGLRALAALEHNVDAVILDGNHNYLKDTHNSHAIIKADQSSLCVASASIIAKVARDNYMGLIDKVHPAYNFASNKGYGTISHRKALKESVSPIHRRSFSFGEFLERFIRDEDVKLVD